MKNYFIGLMLCLATLAQPAHAGWVYEDVFEFTATGDFDGDGLVDTVIADKESGAYRIGYQNGNGTYTWSAERASGVPNLSGMSVGTLLATNRDGLAFVSPEANRINVFNATNRVLAAQPVPVYPDVGLGLHLVLAVDVGGQSNTPLDDLFIASRWNVPGATNAFHLMRNTGNSFYTTNNTSSPGLMAGPNRVRLNTSLPNFGAVIQRQGFSDTLRVYNFTNATVASALTKSSVPFESEFIYGLYRGVTNPGNFLTYVPDGDSRFRSYQVQESPPGTFAIGISTQVDLFAGIQRMYAIEGTNRLAVIFAPGSNVTIYSYDGFTNLVPVQSFTSAIPGLYISSVLAVSPTNFLMLMGDPADGKSSAYQAFAASGGVFVAQGAAARFDVMTAFDGRGNILPYAQEPFVTADPRRLGSFSSGGWSSGLRLPGGNLVVTNETDRGLTNGLGNAAALDLGTAPAGTAFGLANQYTSAIAIFGLDAASGEELAQLTVSPTPGSYASAVQVTLSANPATPIFYALGSYGPWSTYASPIPLFTNTTVYYYSSSTGIQRTAISSATYTFSRRPDSEDADGDGVPDYVEIANGLDPENSGEDADGDGLNDRDELLAGTIPYDTDSDNDGFSDLVELRAGTNPRNGGQFPSTNFVTALYQRAEPFETFDLVVTPKPWNGFRNGITNILTGTWLRAYSVAGDLLAASTAAVNGVYGMARPTAEFLGLPVDVPEGFVAVSTDEHYPLPVTNADRNIGRELVGLFVAPVVSNLDAGYTYAGGSLGLEASNWVNAASSAWSSAAAAFSTNQLTVYHTAAALLFEYKVGQALFNRGEITNADISLFSFRRGDAALVVPTDDQLAGLRYATTSQPAYIIGTLYTSFYGQVRNSSASVITNLRGVVEQVYAISSRSNNGAPGTYDLPVDVLRRFIRTATLPAAYTSAMSLTSANIGNAWSGATQILASAESRPVTNLALYVRNDLYSNACATLYTAGLSPVNLFDASGNAYDFSETFAVVSGSTVDVTGYTDVPASPCGGLAVEVSHISLTAVPVPSRRDADGNLLDDDWELLVFGATGGSATNDSDGDGYSDLQEYLDGTEPLLTNSHSGGAVADLSPPDLNLSISNGTARVYWQWPQPYQGAFQFQLDATANLKSSFTQQFEAASGSSNTMNIDLFGNPATITTRFIRVKMSLQ